MHYAKRLLASRVGGAFMLKIFVNSKYVIQGRNMAPALNSSQNMGQQQHSDEVEVAMAHKKLLYFSDGVMDEDELEEVSENASEQLSEPTVDPKTLTWGPWLSHYAWTSGSKALNMVDYLGEGLAGFFGITTPKYQVEINEFERLQEEKKKMEEESAGWVPKSSDGNVPLVMNAPVIRESDSAPSPV